MTPQQLSEAGQKISHDITRRHFFGRCGVGVGALALNQLLAEDGFGAGPAVDLSRPMEPRAPQFPGKAKNVIFL
ncbi:MAG: sulfatase, partial [Verrucomicrobiota bacterium]